MPQKGYVTKRIAPDSYKAVTKPLAHAMCNSGYPVTLCGNNVNAYHVFQGWHLGYTIDKRTMDSRLCTPQSFDEFVGNFLFRLERELGSYSVYYVKAQDLQAYKP